MNAKPIRVSLMGGAVVLLVAMTGLERSGADGPMAGVRPLRDELSAATDQPGSVSPEAGTPGCDDGLPPEATVADFRGPLIELAFQAASAIPSQPHVKDRSRAQEAVVAVCLQLDQPRRALGYIPRISNWRRGACYADLALYCAEHKCTGQVQHQLDLAENIAEDASDWRRDRIRVKIAQAYALLGRETEAAAFEAGVVDAESGKVERVRARLDGESGFDGRIAALDEVVATGNFELTRNALWTYAALFGRFYGDEARRATVRERIRAACAKVPVMLRIDLLVNLIESALAHRDEATARALVSEAAEMVNDHHWTAEYEVPLRARVAGLMAKAGDTDGARRENEAALAAFDAGRQTIADVFRAEALRPVAEAYWAMGDKPTALAVYRRVVEAGAENPNARPRAIDLSATCCSLALQGVEPDDGLWERLRQIVDGLGDPW